MGEELLAAAQAVLPDVIALRRRLHAEPELGLVLPRTQAHVLEALDGLDLELETGGSTSAVVATLRGARPGRCVLLRADMDALPLEEATGLEFASRHPGRMHACGHDAHVAMLVGAARLLAERRSELAGTVRFLFQPGEEGYGGARILIEEGLLEREPRCDAAFALHVEPRLPPRRVAGRAGPILAAADSFRIELRGRGGHASMPHDARDPIPGAAELVLALQSFVTRRFSPFDPVVLSVTRVASGTTHNVIPATAELEGTIRSVSQAVRERAAAGLEEVARGVATAHGLEARVELQPGYPPTVNDPSAFARARAVADELFGANAFLPLPAPIMGAEDFSYVLERVPGALLFLGVRHEGGEAEPLHSSRMLVNEEALAAGVALHAALALRTLAERGT